jgi:hypothetical protein
MLWSKAMANAGAAETARVRPAATAVGRCEVRYLLTPAPAGYFSERDNRTRPGSPAGLLRDRQTRPPQSVRERSFPSLSVHGRAKGHVGRGTHGSPEKDGRRAGTFMPIRRCRLGRLPRDCLRDPPQRKPDMTVLGPT